MTQLPTETWLAAWRRCSSRRTRLASFPCVASSPSSRLSVPAAAIPRSRRSWTSRTTIGSESLGNGVPAVGSAGSASSSGAGGGVGGEPGGDPGLGRLRCVPPADHPVGQAAEVLDQDQAEHRRDGPDLADPERRGRLEGLQEPADPRLVQLAVGVRHQGEGEGVDLRIPPCRLDGQLGQLGIIAAGEVLLDLAEHLFHDVEVVGEPIGVDPPATGTVDLGVDPLEGPDEDLAVLGEPLQEEVAHPELRINLADRRQLPRQGFQPVQPVQFGPDRRVALRVEERRRGLVRRERLRSVAGCDGRAHPADFLPGWLAHDLPTNPTPPTPRATRDNLLPL